MNGNTTGGVTPRRFDPGAPSPTDALERALDLAGVAKKARTAILRQVDTILPLLTHYGAKAPDETRLLPKGASVGTNGKIRSAGVALRYVVATAATIRTVGMIFVTPEAVTFLLQEIDPREVDRTAEVPFSEKVPIDHARLTNSLIEFVSHVRSRRREFPWWQRAWRWTKSRFTWDR